MGVHRSYKNIWMGLYEFMWIATNSLKLKIVTNCHETVLEYPDLVRTTKHLGCLHFHPSISEVFSVLSLQTLSMPKTSMWGARLYIWPGYLMVGNVIVWNPIPRCPLPHKVSGGLVCRPWGARFVIKVRQLLPLWEKVFSSRI